VPGPEPGRTSNEWVPSSGYWHFRSRADLVTATLQRWEREHTEAVIARADTGADPVGGRRALLAYTTYLGHAQLARTAPDAVAPGGPERQAYLDSVLAALLAR
jgi:AcrR family transcriptional regulator